MRPHPPHPGRSGTAVPVLDPLARGSMNRVMAVAARIKEGVSPPPPLVGIEDDEMTGPIIAFAATDRGLRRENNEDAYLIDAGLGLYVVADGMGGARGGEVASQMAVRCMRDALQAEVERCGDVSADTQAEAHPLYRGVARAVAHANASIYRRADHEPNLMGMGTTLTGLAFAAGQAFLAHVGDSRAYRIRGRTIEQVSDDHTYAQELVRAGSLGPEEARHLPYRHVLSRAVGVEPDVNVDVRAMRTRPGDVFVLCSDGLAMNTPLILSID